MIETTTELHEQLAERVTVQKLADAVREVAEANPTTVYLKPEDSSSCLYFHGEEPGCIIGQAFAKLGIEPFPLLDENHFSVSGLLAPSLGRKETLLFTLAQEAQDEGAPWGTVLSILEENLPSPATPEAKEAA